MTGFGTEVIVPILIILIALAECVREMRSRELENIA